MSTLRDILCKPIREVLSGGEGSRRVGKAVSELPSPIARRLEAPSGGHVLPMLASPIPPECDTGDLESIPRDFDESELDMSGWSAVEDEQ